MVRLCHYYIVHSVFGSIYIDTNKKMGSIVLTTLSLFLGLFFIFIGTIKVTPQVSKELHREIRRDFVQYAKVFPFQETGGFKVSPKQYRLAVGYFEIGTGLVLAVIPGFLKQIANFLLLLLTLTDFYTHAAIADKFERTAPSIVFSLMLSCRLIIYWQVKKRDEKAAAKAAKDKLATIDQPQPQTVQEKKEN